MADIKQIKLPDGSTYNVKAENAEKIRCDLVTSTSTGDYCPLVVNSSTITAEYKEMAVPNNGPEVDIYNGELKASQIVTDFAAIGNITDGYATISPTQSYFPNGIITGNVFCSSMSVGDITDLYTATKTSGNWSLYTSEYTTVHRSGNVIQISLCFKGNGSSVSSGSNGFVGVISGGPLPVTRTMLIGWYSGSTLLCDIQPDGSITARAYGATATLSSASRGYVNGTFICA